MIKSLVLKNFRSYEDREFSFKAGSNILVGKNGVGKTNTLEAIYVVCRGKSWRTKDEALINQDQSWARVDLKFNEDVFSFVLDGREGPIKKTRKINGQNKREGFPTIVLFEPDFIRTLTDRPELRRAWLDEVLSQTNPKYGNALKQFNRALRQRNSLLKQDSFSKDHIFVWNLKLTEFGEMVSNLRKEFIDSCSKEFKDIYESISANKEKIDIEYQPKFSSSYAQEYLKKLEQTIDRDRSIGFTTTGPHREDLNLEFSGAVASERMSRGEFRTAAIVLKQIEFNYLKDKLNTDPILLLDDVLSELDRDRSGRMGVLKAKQVVATTTNTTNLKNELVIEL